MTLEEIEGVLARSLKLRSPVFEATEALGPTAVGAAKKIAAFEDFMLKSANVNGALVEAKHWLRVLGETLADEWDGLQGWEMALKRPRAKATKADIQAAKIAVAPQLFAAGRKAKRLVDSVDDQITRLEREERAVSRAYTMVTGG